ncbi:MAG: ScpA family protein [Acidimicrobiales bacterium]
MLRESGVGPDRRACTAERNAAGIVGFVASCVCTPVFEGPFDVLLRLVSEHRVDVCDVPVASVVDAFVAEMAAAASMDLETTTEFLVIAAILVELKSRKLLPGPEQAEDDEELLSGFEERDRLLARLLELQAYVGIADHFLTMMNAAARCVPRVAGLEERFRDLAPDLLAGITPARLVAAYLRGIAGAPAETLDLSHVTVEAVTVSEAVAELEERLPAEHTLTFRELSAHCTTRMQVIVRFLALLELCKRGRVALDQGETFGDLTVTWIGGKGVLSTVGSAGALEEYEG